MALTLAQKRARNSQQMARVAMRDIRDQEREEAARTRLLIEAGEDLEKAGLLDLDREARRGMCLYATDERAKMEAKWRVRGAEDLAPKQDIRVRVTATFPEGTKLTRRVRAALGDAGLKEDRLLELWKGRVRDYDLAQSIVRANGGRLHRLDDGDDRSDLAEAAE